MLFLYVIIAWKIRYRSLLKVRRYVGPFLRKGASVPGLT